MHIIVSVMSCMYICNHTHVVMHVACLYAYQYSVIQYHRSINECRVCRRVHFFPYYDLFFIIYLSFLFNGTPVFHRLEFMVYRLNFQMKINCLKLLHICQKSPWNKVCVVGTINFPRLVFLHSLTCTLCLLTNGRVCHIYLLLALNKITKLFGCGKGWSKKVTFDLLIRKGGYTKPITEDYRKSIKVTRYQSEKVRGS